LLGWWVLRPTVTITIVVVAVTRFITVGVGGI
jgi:hypothetical protein